MHKLRFVAILLLVSLVFCMGSTVFAESPEGKSSTDPIRIINVVYDDSRSMISDDDGNLVDTWCQAKYAMEVFSSMLGANDTMNIYVMSDFSSKNDSAGPYLVLRGEDGLSTNVSKVHNMITAAGNTPFNSVRKAYSDLASLKADEKWLVVLTDGVFQGVDDVDGFFSKKASDINVMFLGMGPEADEIKENTKKGIYFEKASTSKQILEKITGICTRIFNSDRLDVNVSSKTISFDVPMGELVVFAQGANVNIEGITGEKGNIYLPSIEPVKVSYSKRAATNHDDALVATDLMGVIASFRDDFPAGKYTLNISGANTVEVYYKPNVEVAIYLSDSEGNEVAELENLKAGEYIINFGFVKAGTNEKVLQSSLLGDVRFSAAVTNNGIPHETAYSSGDSIVVNEGSFVLDARGDYLEYNSVSTHLEYNVYKDRHIDISADDSGTEAIVSNSGAKLSQPLRISAIIDGELPTEEQWQEMEVPTITFDVSSPFAGSSVQKGDEPGEYYITPVPVEKLSHKQYTDCEYVVSYENKHGEAVWSGSMSGSIKITDERSWFQRNAELIIRWTIYSGIFLLILGYVPPFKKYLPKRIKNRPAIECSPNMAGIHPMTARGRYRKELASTLIPYKAEEGSLKFTPPGVYGVAVLKIRAAGGNAFFILNTRAYAGKDHVAFDGTPVMEGTVKPIKKSAGTMISITTPEMTYTCIPSND